MSTFFWILMLIIICGMLLLTIGGVILYYKITNRLKNRLVVRIHNNDKTVSHYSFNKTPVNNILHIDEIDNKGEIIPFDYTLISDCIEKGTWGRYIDFDYHVSNPIDPHDRPQKKFIERFIEFYKLMGVFLDTDLHTKLMRNSKFENLVKTLLIILLIGLCINLAVSTAGTIKTFMIKSSDICTLSLKDSSTWNTIYIASHNPPPQPTNSTQVVVHK